MKTYNLSVGFDCSIFDAIDVSIGYTCNKFHHSSRNCDKTINCPMYVNIPTALNLVQNLTDIYLAQAVCKKDNT